MSRCLEWVCLHISDWNFVSMYYLSSSCHMPRLFRFLWTGHLIIFPELYKLLRSPFCTFPLQMFSSAPCSQIPSVCGETAKQNFEVKLWLSVYNRHRFSSTRNRHDGQSDPMWGPQLPGDSPFLCSISFASVADLPYEVKGSVNPELPNQSTQNSQSFAALHDTLYGVKKKTYCELALVSPLQWCHNTAEIQSDTIDFHEMWLKHLIYLLLT